MFRPFGDKLLSEVTAADVRGLVKKAIEEGLFVEYKGQWNAAKIARSVASFANTHGGTLIVGVDAPNKLPVKTTPIADDGQLEDRLIQVIRSNIDPVPAFTPAVVEFPRHKACVIVEVPEGSQPPYLWMSKGQILVRAGSMSEPVPANDRESIDRLYATGQRGLDWARGRIERLPEELAVERPGVELVRVAVHVVTVPAVADGLTAAPRVFTRDFVDVLYSMVPKKLSLGALYATGSGDTVGRHPERSMQEEALTLTWEAGNGGTIIFRAETNGTLRTSWDWEGTVGSGEFWGSWLDTLLNQGLSMHQAILVEELGHRGRVVVAAFLSESAAGPGRALARRAAFSLPVPITDLSEPEFIQFLDRSVSRFRGYPVYEP